MATAISGCKVFSATKAKDREQLGESVTAWLRERPRVEPLRTDVLQSSDDAYHCVTIVVWFSEAPAS